MHRGTVYNKLNKELSGSSFQNLGSNKTTVITAYYQIPSKYKHEDTYHKWLVNFFDMDFKCIVYVDQYTLEFLSKSFPPSTRRQYIVRPFTTFATNAWNWTNDEIIDPERGNGHNKLLYQIWNEKLFMVTSYSIVVPDIISKPVTSQRKLWNA
jgi:hypothetical protein